MPWVGLQCVIVVFPDHTNLLFFLFSCIAKKQIFKKINAMRANIKLLDFHNVLNAPSYSFPCSVCPH